LVISQIHLFYRNIGNSPENNKTIIKKENSTKPRDKNRKDKITKKV
jgi:hypothetical protein